MMPATRRASGGMGTAPPPLAAESGAPILAEGGTAIEAALAIAAALAVVYPHMTGLGGDSFWLVAEPGCVPRTIDGAGRAGAGVSAALYEERDLHAVPWRGPLAANTVAGAVSAWQSAWEINAEWQGRLPLSRLVEDAIALSLRGTIVTASHSDAVHRFRAELEPLPGFSTLHFIRGEPPNAGDRLVQPALARTLAALAGEGLESFYTGALAEQMPAELP